MGEYSRNKDFRKKEFQLSKDNRRGSAILLTKSDSKDHGMKKLLTSSNKEEKQQPTILIKTREGERAISPNSKSNSLASSTKKDAEQPQPVYQLQSKPSTTETVIPPEMTSPVKLLDLESFGVVDNCLEFLSEQSDFLVVGIVGYQGVGKSTILSLLANPKSSEEHYLFATEKPEDTEVAAHKTDGIDMYVTRNRIIYLDTQPIMSPSVNVKLLQQQDSNLVKKYQHSDYPIESTDVEIQSLQLITFLFSICHVVLFVQDYWLDPDLIRFLQTAEMLKPSTPTALDEAIVEYFPHIIFLHNKAQPSDFEPRRMKEMQDIYCKTFSHSRLQFQTGFGLANGEINPALSVDSCGELMNLFLLPEMNGGSAQYKGHSGFQDLILHLRRQILSTPKTPLTHSSLTEKNWFHYASKVWDGIKKSTFFNEYHRLLNNV